MTPDDVRKHVRGYPNMNLGQGWNIYNKIRERGCRRVLELGFNWGVSTCYIAAAIADHPDGRVVTVDLASRVAFDPGIEGLLQRCGLRERAIVFYEHTSYTWRLRAFLRMNPPPEFDLIFLDGAHLWEPDGLAFVLAERMLRPGGMVILDDLNWTFRDSPHFGQSEMVRAMPEDERSTPQVREVFELLVKPHPHIAKTWENSSWGFALKRRDLAFVQQDQTAADAELARAAAESKRHALARHPRALERDELREKGPPGSARQTLKGGASSPSRPPSSATDPRSAGSETTLERYSREWFEAVYRELGDGIPCYRPTALYDGKPEDGMLRGCSCCLKNIRLNLLPNEEQMFHDDFNEVDFRLEDNPRLPGRKVIVCSKLGMCNGRKPYVCRTHPVYFVRGLFMIEESLCRLLASTFLTVHHKAVERLRQVIYKFGLEEEVLGYGRRIENGYIDYER
jgi:predicted O-methyltransferase YrrM